MPLTWAAADCESTGNELQAHTHTFKYIHTHTSLYTNIVYLVFILLQKRLHFVAVNYETV